jgi:hypothetical protein
MCHAQTNPAYCSIGTYTFNEFTDFFWFDNTCNFIAHADKIPDNIIFTATIDPNDYIINTGINTVGLTLVSSSTLFRKNDMFANSDTKPNRHMRIISSVSRRHAFQTRSLVRRAQDLPAKFYTTASQLFWATQIWLRWRTWLWEGLRHALALARFRLRIAFGPWAFFSSQLCMIFRWGQLKLDSTNSRTTC